MVDTLLKEYHRKRCEKPEILEKNKNEQNDENEIID